MNLFRKDKILSFTYIIAYINIGMFLLKSFLPADPSILADIQLGAKVNYLIADGEFFRLVTSMFLHADITHLLFNTIALLSIGTEIEDMFGKRKFLIIYFVSGICGSALSFLLNDNIAIGASGAIFGLLGTHLFLYSLNPQSYKQLFNNGVFIIILINLVIGFTTPTIDNFAHFGGLIGGAFVCFAFVNTKNKPNFKVLKYMLPGLLVIFVAFTLTVGVWNYKATESYYYNKGIYSLISNHTEVGINTLLEGQRKFSSKQINDLVDELKKQGLID